MSEKIVQDPKRRSAKKVFAVVLVGGKGKRLRPLSTDARPKAFLSITADRRTMFRNTINRISKLIDPSRIVVVANKAHRSLVKKDMPGIKADRLILEPVSRNTGPAVALAARILQQKDKADVIVILPTDHYIPDSGKQLKCLRAGINAVLRRNSSFVVFGLEPNYPATGFGYIKLKGQSPKTGNVYQVDKFVEKPDEKTARKYLASGRYLWNSGIFVFSVDELMKACEKVAPDIFRHLREPSRALKSYAKMPDISIDYAIMEKVKGISCVKGSYGWSDVGSFDSLKQVLKREGRRFIEKDGKVLKIL
jgi:Mannose-1-phosphate guanylyltransferase